MTMRVVHEDGMCFPVVICDSCGNPITHATDGNYQWLVHMNGDTDGTLFFTHKACCHTFEMTHEHPNAVWYAEELCDLPLFLGNNLELDWAEVFKRLRVLAEAGWVGQRSHERTEKRHQ